MVGDQSDILARLKSVLPSRWFADTTPILDGLLSGFAALGSWAYGLIGYARQQTRIATASDGWLDLIATDFFGWRLTRRAAETDTAFRARIGREMFRVRATRPALIAQLQDLTGRTPRIFEPSRPADTGAWNGALGYGLAGGWGSLSLPYQCFVVAYRPMAAGSLGGTGYCDPAGGYGAGDTEYGTLSGLSSPVGDAEIYAAIAAIMPACGIAWTHISS